MNRTHYLHHYYYAEETGRWILVWRRNGFDPWSFSAFEPGDRCTTSKTQPVKVGRTRTFDEPSQRAAQSHAPTACALVRYTPAPLVPLGQGGVR